jgi:hypothetical protein
VAAILECFDASVSPSGSRSVRLNHFCVINSFQYKGLFLQNLTQMATWPKRYAELLPQVKMWIKRDTTAILITKCRYELIYCVKLNNLRRVLSFEQGNWQWLFWVVEFIWRISIWRVAYWTRPGRLTVCGPLLTHYVINCIFLKLN